MEEETGIIGPLSLVKIQKKYEEVELWETGNTANTF